MRFVLKEELPFIHSKGILSGDIVEENGAKKLTSGSFVQFLKESEYKQIIDSMVTPSEEVEIEKKEQEPAEQIAAENQEKSEDDIHKKGRGTRRK